MSSPPLPLSELNAAILQAIITLGLAVLCALFFARYHKRYFLWWAVAWTLYALRLAAIIVFVSSNDRFWLYFHQVLTGWTALALLGAALVFSQQLRLRNWHLALLSFPVLWSYVAIYRLRSFLLASGPMVLFLSAATLWTGWVFLRYRRHVRSRGAVLLAVLLTVWGLHHLDYPLLRARGAWNPWGYYLDILFVLGMGVGIVMLVLEDLGRGIETLAALSGDLTLRGSAALDTGNGVAATSGNGAAVDDGMERSHAIDALLARPLSLAGVRGSALYLGSAGDGQFVRGVGACAAWTGTRPIGLSWEAVARAIERGRPEVSRGWEDPASAPPRAYAYAAVLPIIRRASTAGALVFVGDEGDPFTALGDGFLHALGLQVGAALEHADLHARLEARSRELEHLGTRMVQQYEDERRRISLELHDETAQMFAAVKLQLGVLRESVAPASVERVDRALSLVDAGMRSIRNVTRDLRPSLLDDLGLVPALRALVAEFGESAGWSVTFDAPPAVEVPALSGDAELALFRALQEALANVARHASAKRVAVAMRCDGSHLELEVRDDGRGLDGRDADALFASGRLGLAGMRQRLVALRGTLAVDAAAEGGLRVVARIPCESEVVS